MGQFSSFWRDLRQFSGRRLWVAAALVTVGALLDALGILAIIPVFALVIGQAESGAGRELLLLLSSAGLDTRLLQASALSLAFLLLIAARGVIQRIRDVYLKRLGLEFADAVRMRAFRDVSMAPWAAIVDYRRGDIEHTIVKDAGRLSKGSEQLLRSAAPVAMIVTQIAIIGYVSPPMLLVAAALVLGAVAIGYPLARKAGLLGQDSTRTGRQLQGILTNFMGGQKLARLHDAQENFAVLLERSMTRSRELHVALTASEGSMRTLFQTIAAAAVVAMLLAGYFALSIDPARLIVATVLMARIAPPTQAVLVAAQAVANMLPAHASLKELIGNLEAAMAGTKSQTVTTHAADDEQQGAASLSAEGISFAYKQGVPVLSDFSFSVSPGQIVAIAGPSGCGKTTFLDIVTGLLAAHEGTVSANGKILADPAEWEAWRQQIAYLPQDPFLFDATLRENIVWFHPDADDEAIATALEMAEATKVVDRFPEGLESRVGDRGQALSGGERQRICLARGLMVKPRLLILDEAMSALDEESCVSILGRLKAWPERPTILLVSHRAEHRAMADRVVHVDGKSR